MLQNKYINFFIDFMLANVDYYNKVNDILMKIEEDNKNNICFCKSLLSFNKIILSNLSLNLTILKNFYNGNFQKGIII